MLTYKGFLGSTDFDENADVFFGNVINANTIISFRGSSVEDLKTSFYNLVDSYLDDCEREGISPEKPFSGKITVRVSPTLHRKVAIRATENKESMNQYLEELIANDTADLLI